MNAESWQEAKGILAEALLCPPSEREALVAARCANADLRREVHAYLNQYDDGFLETVLTVSQTFDSTLSASVEADRTPDIRPGDRVGPYIVLDRLGVGGMGHVFLGDDARLQRKVALKCLSVSAPAAELRARLLQEARAAARITHPNIAIVYDVIEHEDRPFLVMEYVAGESLAALLKRERLDVGRILDILRQLASALSAAHANGIIHRDLKPANVQVMPDGSVKILDFGVAQAISAVRALAGSAIDPAAIVPARTTPSTISASQSDQRIAHPGTPAYMSPEQLFGRALDQRSDIYSLGVIVYEMAAGHRPYAADDPFDVVLMLSRDLLRADAAVGDLPDRLKDLVAKMLAVKAEDRYQTAADVAAAAAALMAPSHAAALPAERSLRFRLRAIARAGLVVAVVPVAVAFIGFVTNAVYNVELDRPSAFGGETALGWLSLGFGSLVTPVLVYVIPAFVALWGVRFVFRLLRLSTRVDRVVTESRSRGERLGVRIGLGDPSVFGQAIAAFGLLALIAIIWYCWDVVQAVMIVAPKSDDFVRLTSPLTLGHNERAHDYRMYLTLLSLALGIGAYRLARLRRRTGRGLAGLLVVVMLLVVAVAMDEGPYRYMWRSTLERVAYGSERCYITGEQSDRLLLFCPDAKPHKNRIVSRRDASVRRTGTVESIFTRPETSR